MPFPKYSPALLVLLALAGCAKEDETRRSDANAGVSHRVLEGSITANVQAVQDSRWKEPCDEKFRDKQLEIAAALDARAGEVSKFQSAGSAPSSYYRVVPAGPTFVREKIDPPAGKPGWSEDRLGWADLIASYERIKDTPMGKDWVNLTAAVRGYVLDDVGRVVNGYNYGIAPSMVPKVKELQSVVELCVANVDCKHPELKPELKEFVKTIPSFEPYLLLGDLDDLAERRRYTEKFLKRIRSDLALFEFKVNPLVKQTAPGQFELPIDLGPFAVVPDQIRRYVENEWKGQGRQLTLQWKDQRDYPDVFRILLGEQLGERAYVMWSKKEMTLFPNVRTRSIAHEMGHVLGFPDFYTTVWNPQECHYVTHLKQSALMGDSDDGVVLEEDWQELAKQYPLGK